MTECSDTAGVRIIIGMGRLFFLRSGESGSRYRVLAIRYTGLSFSQALLDNVLLHRALAFLMAWCKLSPSSWFLVRSFYRGWAAFVMVVVSNPILQL